ncbi:MAG: ArsR family transcriptional regulator [Methanobrevibacter sp.]|jgi:predicted transcriptional regulator|nr:ArsR family transcriptional regulator [Candidatus Methanoflexus mossambicus]
MDKKTVDLIVYIKLSEHRKDTLKLLSEELLFPSEIGKRLKMSPANISRTLKGLEEKGLVKCLNPERKVGRLYQTTELGNKILNNIKKKK